MYTIRHYWVRLRWSRRTPYRVVRSLTRLGFVLVGALVFLDLAGIASPQALIELIPRP
jgi:hypothetical protein